MPPERKRPTLVELVAECLERRDLEGEDALEQLCAAHPERAADLRARLAQLDRIGLAGGERSFDALARSAAEPGRALPEAIGRFRIEAELGHGGMGVVYRAFDPTLGRSVALKVMGPLHGAGRERFEREVRAVAKLAHPGIVPIYEVGEAEGRPCFVMELVEGVDLASLLGALRARCTQGGIGPERLDLAALDAAWRACAPDLAPPPWRGRGYLEAVCSLGAEVARALEHAHERGIVHRDVKPSNVLVRGDGRALLLDFGLARIEGDPSLTRTGAFAGTLSYASPEQALDGAVDRRSDVYSLGATLYQLLTLRPPFRGSSATDVARQIQSREPTPPRRLNPAVPRDLQTICLAALEKEPARRYATAGALADDIDRCFELRPIAARPAGAWTRTVRAVRRRPALASAVGLAALLAVGAPVGFGIAYARIRDERNTADAAATAAKEEAARANRERHRLELTNGFWERLLLTLAPENRGSDVSVLELMEAAERGLDQTAGLDVETEALYRTAIGRTDSRLQRVEAARANLERALELYEQLDDAPREAMTLAELGIVHQNSGRLERAEAIFRELLEGPRAADLEPHLLEDLRFHLGQTVGWSGRHAEARALLTPLLEDGRAPEDVRTAWIRFELGAAAHGLGELAVAEQHYREGFRIAEALEGPNGFVAAQHALGMAEVLELQGRPAEAEQLVRGTLPILEERLGADSLAAAQSHARLGALLEQRGDHSGALEHALRARPALEQAPGVNGRGLLGDLNTLTSAHMFLGDRDACLESARAGLALLERYDAPYPDEALIGFRHVAHVLWERDELDETIAVLERLEREIREKGGSPSLHATVQERLGRSLTYAGRPDEAVPWLERALAKLRAVASDAAPETSYELPFARAWFAASTARWLACALAARGADGDLARARREVERSLADVAAFADVSLMRALRHELLRTLAVLAARGGEPELASVGFDLVEEELAADGDDPEGALVAALTRGFTDLRFGDGEEATSWLERALARSRRSRIATLRDRAWADELGRDLRYSDVELLVGIGLAEAGRAADAAALWTGALERLEAGADRGSVREEDELRRRLAALEVPAGDASGAGR